MIDREELLNEARDGGPSAEELKAMAEALARRVAAMQTDLASLAPESPAYASLTRRIATVKRQLQALAEETSITEFVEQSTEATLRAQQLRGW